MVLAAADLVVLVLLHVLRPDVDPVLRPTSEYALGPLGGLMLFATVGVGVAALLLVPVLRPRVPGTPGRVGLVLLGLFGVVKVVQAAFPIDPPGTATAVGAVHDVLGTVAFVALPVAAVLLARATGARAPLWVAAGLSAALLVVLAGAPFGLAQRVYLVLATGWLLVTALAAAPGRPDGRRAAAPA